MKCKVTEGEDGQMLGRIILFLASALFVAGVTYIAAHDLAALCNSTIWNASVATAVTLGAAWVAAAILDVVAFWL
jgi:hypothetical protein